MVSCRGVSRYEKSSGTGRSVERTMAVSLPLRAVSALANLSESPMVADISKKVDWGIVSSGTCQATPRSRSA